MAADNSFQSNVESLLKAMDGYIHSKTVVGEPITVGDTILLPLIDVSFGVAAAAAGGQDKTRQTENEGGGLGCKMIPSAVLVIQNGSSKLVSVRNQDSFTKVMDMVPDFVNRFVGGSGKRAEEKSAGAAATADAGADKADASGVPTDQTQTSGTPTEKMEPSGTPADKADTSGVPTDQAQTAGAPADQTVPSGA